MERAHQINRTKREIEVKLLTMGDYVKIDYLQRTLKGSLDGETKKFVQQTLSKIYETRGMFLEAAKVMKHAADAEIAERVKVLEFMKSVELFVKSGYFDEADATFRTAVSLVRESEKNVLKNELKKFYLMQAVNYEKNKKRDYAKRTYEKILTLNLAQNEKT